MQNYAQSLNFQFSYMQPKSDKNANILVLQYRKIK